MKRKLLLFTIALLCAVVQRAWADSQPWTDFAEKPQLEDGKYVIKTAGNLAWLAKNVNSGDIENVDVIQQADIDLGGHEWVPIGTYDHPYVGNYNGKGYTIRNLICHRSSENSVGLFGNMGRYYKNTAVLIGSISDVVLLDSEIEGLDDVGGICGRVDGAFVSHCITNAKVSGNAYVGGIVGYSQKYSMYGSTRSYACPEICNCLYIGGSNITSKGSIGFIIGYVDERYYREKIHDNYFTNSTVTAHNEFDLRGYELNYSPVDDVSLSFPDNPCFRAI